MKKIFSSFDQMSWLRVALAIAAALTLSPIFVRSFLLIDLAGIIAAYGLLACVVREAKKLGFSGFNFAMGTLFAVVVLFDLLIYFSD